MRCLLAVILALIAASAALGQDKTIPIKGDASSTAPGAPPAPLNRRLIKTRVFTLKVACKERPVWKELWVSRDDGKIWKLAKDAEIVIAWSEWAEGVLRCRVRVPEDGPYDFFAQLGDSISNRTPEPASGTIADPNFRLDVVEGPKVSQLALDEPQERAEWTGGQTVTLKWHAIDPDFKERSAELSYKVENEPWTPITKGLETTGTFEWVVPNRATTHLRLRLLAVTRQGIESAAVSAPINVRKTHRADVVQARALYDRARVLHAQQRVTEALLKYQESLAAWPDFAEVHNDLGKLHLEQREPAKALEQFLRARTLSSADPAPSVNAAHTEAELGLVEDALAHLRDAIALGLESKERLSVQAGEILWSIARAAKNSGDDKRCMEACGMILEIRDAARPTRAKAEQMLEWMKRAK